MYGDKNLEFSVAGRDAAATMTRALPMGQGDLKGKTDGMGPYNGLFVFASAGEDTAAGFVITMRHCDTKDGTYEALMAFPAASEAKSAGDVLVKHPVPFGVKNWVRFELSEAKEVNIVMTRDADKWINGLVKGE